MQYQEMLKQRAQALRKSEAILAAAETAHRELTAEESYDVDNCMTAVKALNPQIESHEKLNTMHKLFTNGRLITGGTGGGPRGFEKNTKVTFSEDYPQAFYEWVQSGGKNVSAALYEGSNPAGGYVVPSIVDDQIVPLAPNEMAVRQISKVIPTTMDIRIPRKGAFGNASAKAENAAFVEADPTLEQFTLSAFMVGNLETISWELAQDVPAFQSFCITDLILAVQMLEEAWFVTGTGTGQAQGLIGNTGTGVTEEPDAAGNMVSITGTLDILATLNAVYHPNASWLMSRATSVIIRKAQAQANLFSPVWTREGKQDFLHGYPVYYSVSMPTAARGHTPVLFGDFLQGYVIGDRGGSGINVKILDQPLATQGQIALLGFRRVDGRVRRSAAIQAYNVAAT